MFASGNENYEALVDLILHQPRFGSQSEGAQRVQWRELVSTTLSLCLSEHWIDRAELESASDAGGEKDGFVLQFAKSVLDTLFELQPGESILPSPLRSHLSTVHCRISEILAGRALARDEGLSVAYDLYNECLNNGYSLFHKESYLNLAELEYENFDDVLACYKYALADNTDPRFGLTGLRWAGMDVIWWSPDWPFGFSEYSLLIDDAGEYIPAILIASLIEEHFVSILQHDPLTYLSNVAKDRKVEDETVIDAVLAYYGLVMVGVLRKEWAAVAHLSQDFTTLMKESKLRENVADSFTNGDDFEEIYYAILEAGQHAHSLPNQEQLAAISVQIDRRLGGLARHLLPQERTDLQEAEYHYQRYKDLQTPFGERPTAISLCVAVERIVNRKYCYPLSDRLGYHKDSYNDNRIKASKFSKMLSGSEGNKIRDRIRRLFPKHWEYLTGLFVKEIEEHFKIRNKVAHGNKSGPEEKVTKSDLEKLREIAWGNESGREGMLRAILSLPEQ